MIEINNLSKSYGINKIFENESITLTNIVVQLSRQKSKVFIMN